MIRSLLRNAGRLLAAMVLLALAFCAVEVGLRLDRLGQPVEPHGRPAHQPSAISYIEPAASYSAKTAEESGPRELVLSEWGTRGLPPIVPKPRGTYRILCLGSEETLAAELAAEASFCHLLQQHLDASSDLNIEVLNAGCPETSPLSNCLRLRQRLLSVQPDFVLFLIHPPELGRDAAVRASLRLDAAGNPAWSRHPGAPSREPLVQRVRTELATVDWVYHRVQPTLIPDNISSPVADLTPPQWTDLLEVLRYSQELARSHYSGFGVALVPDIWEVSAASTKKPTLGMSLRSQLQPVVAQGQLLVLDELPQFQVYPNPKELFTRQGRLSPMGHRLLAASLAEEVMRSIPGIWGRREYHKWIAVIPANSSP